MYWERLSLRGTLRCRDCSHCAGGGDVTAPAIECKNVVFRYPNGVVALEGINFSIEECSKVVLLGENGSGKTTLLLHLNGLHEPTSGEVTILGKLVNKANIDWVRTKVGMIFQNSDDQLFAPTVFQDVAFGPRNLGLDEIRVRERVDEVLDVLNVAHLRDRPPDALSGGEKRRVALAGILVMDAEIIVLDEPHSGLDPLGSLEFDDILNELHSKGRTIVVATHDVEFAASWADQCVIMKNGQIVGCGTPEDVFSDAEAVSRSRLKLPSFVSVYNELQARNFVSKRGEVPFDVMDLVHKVEAPSIKFIENPAGLHKGAHVGLAYSRDSWVVEPEGSHDGEILTQNENIAVIELNDESALKKGDIVIFKVHDDERYDERVAARAKKLIESNRGIKTGAMGTNAKLLAKRHAISLDFEVDVINTALSYASRGDNVILLASGNMAEHAGKKIYKICPDIFFHYVNAKDEETL
ncbi:MAG: energy-coupling factor ABC transporter ATP-binding protein [Halobacteriota archaeon]